MSDVNNRVAIVELMAPSGSWVRVGHLQHRNEVTRFESSMDYWQRVDRPILGQIFEERGPDWRPSQRVALPTWFSHLLPEGFLRAAVSAAIHTKPQREFPMLMRVGEDDLPGAVRVALAEETFVDGELEALSSQHTQDDDSDPVLKFSLAGVQPKFSVILDPVRGLTIPARGEAGNYIVKLPDGRPGFEEVPEAELACLMLAQAVGINAADAQLVDVAAIAGLPSWAKSHPGKALAVKRFDRLPDGLRVHAEVFAQVLEVPTANERLKYTRSNFETVASLTAGLCGEDAALEVIDRIVLNVLLGNGDAHLKNWALTYPDGFKATLSPAYDIVPTVLFIPDDDLGMKLGGSRNFAAVTLRSFDRIATRLNMDTMEVRRRISSAVEKIEAAWPLLTDYLTRTRYKMLTRRRDNLPLFKQRG